MGLFGALFAGVSGLNSQSNKIGIISNNISNVNTVGFKQASAAFNTLVVPSGTSTFSPGGVIGQTQSLVNQQGLIQATSSSTDAAITGGGFFVVNSQADGSGSTFLTRAGSFTQDSLGNFINANGYFLQGVPVTTPATALNQGNLRTVNINSSASGAATPTSTMTIAANLNASQGILRGSGEVATLKGDTTNVANTASQIIVPTVGAVGSGANNLTRGDTLTITSLTAGAPFVLTYGGFATGRDITATYDTGGATAGEGDGAGLLDKQTVTGANITNTGGTNVISVTVANSGDYVVGGTISLKDASAINGIPASQINGIHTIASKTSNTITFTTTATGTGSTNNPSTTSATASNRTLTDFTGNILDAQVPGGDFLSGHQDLASTFTSGALQFSIATTNSGTFTFTYSQQAQASSGQFNSLNSLVAAINSSSNGKLTASVVNNRLYVSPADANEGMTFVNGDATGAGSLAGINWVQELDLPATGLANINLPVVTNSGVNRYNSLAGLANTINNNDTSHNLVATLSSTTGTGPTLSINETDPQSQVTFSDTNITSSNGSIMKAFGFVGPNGTALTARTSPAIGYTTTLDKTYSAGDPSTDMSSGAVTAQFSKDITIFDSLGNSHTVTMDVAKIGVNRWAIELKVPASELATSSSGTNDGQIASGIVSFNGDGTFSAVSAQTNVNGDSIASPVVINWSQSGPTAVGALPSTIAVDLTGMIQSSGAYNVSVANQNGSSVGELTGVTIDQSGYVVASFSNGQTQKIYQVPLAIVNNPNGLQGVSGDAFQQTLASGQVNLEVAGTNGTGTITPSALEQSNVDLSTQLTNLIVAQQAYGANSKVLTIADQLLQQLDQIIQ